LIIFIAYWIGIIIVTVHAHVYGDYRALLYGRDYGGEMCGIKSGEPGDPSYFDNEAKPFLYYPSINQQFSAAIKPFNGKYGFSGVCVPSCPKRGDVTLMDKTNYTAAYDTKNLFWRCLDDYTWQQIPSIQCYRWKDKAGKEYEGDDTCHLYMAEYNNSEYDGCTSGRTSKKAQFPIIPCATWDHKYTNKGLEYECVQELNRLYPHCQDVLTGVAEMNDLPIDENPIYKTLVGFSMFVGRYFSDLCKSTGVILFVGLIATSLMSYLWVWGAQIYVRPVVMGTLALAVVVPLVLTLILWGKAGKLGGKAQDWVDEKTSVEIGGLAGSAASVTGVSAALGSIGEKEYETMAIVSSVFTSLLFLLVCAILDKVELACGILVEASVAIERMPLLLTFPILPTLVMAFLFFFSIPTLANLLASGDISFHASWMTTYNTTTHTAELALTESSVDGEIAPWNLFMAVYYFYGKTHDINSVPPTSREPTYLRRVSLYLVYLFYLELLLVASFTESDPSILTPCSPCSPDVMCLGIYWTFEVIQGLSIMTIAGAVTKWYWRKGGKIKLSAFPTKSSLYRALRFHVGTACFGGAIVLVVQTVQWIYAYIHMRLALNKSRIVQAVLCCIGCIVHCCVSIVKEVSYSAYIITAMRGRPFCFSAARVLFLFGLYPMRVMTVQVVTSYVLWIGKMVITTVAGLLTFALFELTTADVPSVSYPGHISWHYPGHTSWHYPGRCASYAAGNDSCFLNSFMVCCCTSLTAAVFVRSSCSKCCRAPQMGARRS
jgi:choline transporter-like protein 2/4/5